MELKKCEPIIEEIIYVTRPWNKKEKEDVKQNLWLMILQFVKDNREHLDTLGSDEERIKLIKDSVKRSFDNQNNCKRKNFLQVKIIDDEGNIKIRYLPPKMVSIDSIDESELSDVSDAPDEIIFGAELQEILDEWVISRDGSIKEFIRECVCPSKEVLDKWDNLMELYPRYKHFQDIPPKTLAIQILNIPEGKYRSFMSNLSYFLSSKGYGNRKLEFGNLRHES